MTATSSRYAYEGTETTETSITRDGGFTDLTGSQQSRKIVTTANAQWLRPFKAESYSVWNPTTGVDVDVTVYGMLLHADVLPNNDDIWVDLSYLGDGSSTLGTIVNTTKSNLLAANAVVDSDSSMWPDIHASFDGSVTTMIMSNNNLTASYTGIGGSVFSLSRLSAGKHYAEFTVARPAGGSIADYIVLDGETAGITFYYYMASPGIVAVNSVDTAVQLGAIVDGDVLCAALDLDANLGWFRRNNGNWNNSGTANPATGAGGITITADAYAPSVQFGAGAGARSVTGNFGQSSYAFTPPIGFGDWLSLQQPFKLTTTLDSPQPGLAGLIEARVHVGKASAIYYIDPQIELTPAGGGTVNGATAYKSSRYTYEGTETTETSIVRTGGAVDPTGQAQSRKIVTTANAQWLRPFKAEPYAIWNDTTGVDVDVTVCGTVNSASLPNNDDIWLEVEYLGDGASTLGSIVHTTKSNLLAANAAVVSDGSSWSGGGSGAGWSPFKLTTTLDSPQPGQPGYIHARVKVGKASATYYLDPQITLS